MPKRRAMINSDSALPKVAAFLEERVDSFFSPGYIVNHPYAGFKPRKDGIGGEYSSTDHRALSHALTLGIHYDREALDDVSQLRIWNMTGNSIYGVYYGILHYSKPQEITATHDPKGRVEFPINDGLVDGHASGVKRVNRVIPRRVAPASTGGEQA